MGAHAGALIRSHVGDIVREGGVAGRTESYDPPRKLSTFIPGHRKSARIIGSVISNYMPSTSRQLSQYTGDNERSECDAHHCFCKYGGGSYSLSSLRSQLWNILSMLKVRMYTNPQELCCGGEKSEKARRGTQWLELVSFLFYHWNITVSYRATCIYLNTYSFTYSYVIFSSF